MERSVRRAEPQRPRPRVRSKQENLCHAVDVPKPREIIADPLYNSTLVEKFVNSMMWDGKKTTAQKIFYSAMEVLRERSGDDPLKAFKKAVENVKPMLEVKTRRVGGANYQVPVEVPQNRRDQSGAALDHYKCPHAAGQEHGGQAGE